MYVCLCAGGYLIMHVCNLSPPERLDRFSCFFFCSLRLGQGKVLSKKIGSGIQFYWKYGKSFLTLNLYLDKMPVPKFGSGEALNISETIPVQLLEASGEAASWFM